MSESEAMLHEANRRAHRLARAAREYVKRRDEAAQMRHGTDLHIRACGDRYGALRRLRVALDAYAEIEARQQKEATR